jgi:hypothetical protein
VRANGVDQVVSQGKALGRCSRRRRPENIIRAGKVAGFRRTVAVVAFARAATVMVAAALVRLNAMTGRASRAGLRGGHP